MMFDLRWSKESLTTQKLGAFGEHYAKMLLASYGMSIYSADVDDHGIDFVAENKSGFLKFQVKTVREGTSYVYMLKKIFNTADDNLYLFLIRLIDDESPESYIIPATEWESSDTKALVYHDYAGKKSKPEYGVNISKKNMPILSKYKLKHMIDKIL